MMSSRYAAALVFCATTGVSQAAEIVVLESNSVRYAAGQTLDAAVPITLPAGEFVAIVTEDARLIRIEGPHNGPAVGQTPDEGAVRRALAQLIVEQRPEVGGVGGVRGDGDEAQAPDTRPEPWLVHTQRSGEQCALRGQGVQLWRESATDAAVAELTASLEDATGEVRWNSGEQRAAWPMRSRSGTKRSTCCGSRTRSARSPFACICWLRASPATALRPRLGSPRAAAPSKPGCCCADGWQARPEPPILWPPTPRALHAMKRYFVGLLVLAPLALGAAWWVGSAQQRRGRHARPARPLLHRLS